MSYINLDNIKLEEDLNNRKEFLQLESFNQQHKKKLN